MLGESDQTTEKSCKGCGNRLDPDRDTVYEVVQKLPGNIETDDSITTTWAICQTCAGDTLDAVNHPTPDADSGPRVELPRQATRDLVREAAAADGLDAHRARLVAAEVTADGELALLLNGPSRETNGSHAGSRSEP